MNLFHNHPVQKLKNFRIEQHQHNPYALSAGDNAQIEEADAKDRDSRKHQRVDEFLTQTRQNVIKKEAEFKRERDELNQ